MATDVPTTTIEVDMQAADILRRVSQRAHEKGETLGSYLSHTLPDERESLPPSSQREAWEAFVTGMVSWSSVNLPAGFVADDRG
jgi:hypothetical protein